MKSEAEKASNRASYQFLKSRGICTRCGKEYAEIGITLCSNCAERMRMESIDKYWKEPGRREQQLNHKRDRRKLLKENGICTRCGKKPVYMKNEKIYCTCYNCYIKQKIKRKERRDKENKKYREYGLCVWCGGERVDGKMMCKTCLDELKKRGLNGSRKSMENRKKNDGEYIHPWVKDERMQKESLKAKKESNRTGKSLLQNEL